MITKKTLFTFAIALLGAVAGVFTYSKIVGPQKQIIYSEQPAVTRYATYEQPGGYPDLTIAAEQSVNAVVHVKVKAKATPQNFSTGDPFYDFFFGPGGANPQSQQPRMGFGSGVIISADGYIITNNHVIDDADEIEVVLNNRQSFNAKLVGKDPTTDIALLKIDAKELQFLNFGNSDALKVGEWVIAVGNPFNLTSTVTAGIVSAKSRSINILSNQSQSLGIEAFIQTDAAVNPGNSGGALVNSRGELVGINTAIASQTGSYSGYSFAVPISIAAKVVNDLKEFGVAQRALLGVSIRDIDGALAAEKNIEKIEGIYVAGVNTNSAAKEAGIEEGDIILSVNNERVNSVPELQEKISRHRPGDKVTIKVKRLGKEKQFTVTLRNSDGSTSLIKSEDINVILGAHMKELTGTEKQSLQLRSGIKIESLDNGKLKNSGIKEGMIITQANRVLINSVDDFRRVVASANEGLFITGVYPNGQVEYYAINLSN